MKENITKKLNISEETILRAVRTFLNDNHYNLTKKHLKIDENCLHFKNAYNISCKQAGISNYYLDDNVTETVEVTINLEELNEIMELWYFEREPKIKDVKIEITPNQTGEYHVSGTAKIMKLNQFIEEDI
jgi:hypothetical protein